MEDLNQMIQEETEAPAKFVDADFPEEEEVQATEPEAVQEAQVPTANTVPITTLGLWFEQYREMIPNVHQVGGQIRGVASGKYLIVSVDDPNGQELEAGIVERSLNLFDNANIQPVIDMQPSDMRVYNNNTFRIIYTLSEDAVVKMYGVKTGLIAMFSYAIDGGILPYEKVVAKKRATELEIPQGNIEVYRQNLNNPIDLEALQLLYRQSAKANTTFTTVRDAVNWLLARQDNITDINHHLEIDRVIMTLLS